MPFYKKRIQKPDSDIEKFEKETGKNAIWKGKETKGFIDWKNK